MHDHVISLDDNYRAIRMQRQGLPPVGANNEVPRHSLLNIEGALRVGRGGTICVTQLELIIYMELFHGPLTCK